MRCHLCTACLNFVDGKFAELTQFQEKGRLGSLVWAGAAVNRKSVAFLISRQISSRMDGRNAMVS